MTVSMPLPFSGANRTSALAFHDLSMLDGSPLIEHAPTNPAHGHEKRGLFVTKQKCPKSSEHSGVLSSCRPEEEKRKREIRLDANNTNKRSPFVSDHAVLRCFFSKKAFVAIGWERQEHHNHRLV